jgi:hypothetical protein
VNSIATWTFLSLSKLLLVIRIFISTRHIKACVSNLLASARPNIRARSCRTRRTENSLMSRTNNERERTDIRVPRLSNAIAQFGLLGTQQLDSCSRQGHKPRRPRNFSLRAAGRGRKHQRSWTENLQAAISEEERHGRWRSHAHHPLCRAPQYPLGPRVAGSANSL